MPVARLPTRLLPLALALVASTAGGAPSGPAAPGPGPRASSAAQSAYWYFCPAGLVETTTADAQANGRYCSYWLLGSFPLGGDEEPRLNRTPVPGLDVLPVWGRTRGAGVTVAVVDTGVDTGSPDLAPNLLPGWNAYGGNADVSDRSGHGTLVASIVAAPAGNGGYVGIAPEAKILPVKVMGGGPADAWSDRAVVQGIEFAIRHGARVVNLSLGGLDAPIAGVEGALADAEKAGVLVVIAAGNDGVNLDDGRHTESPDGYGLANTLTVADFTDRGTLADDSNYGAWHVQIASLGTALWGDYPGNPTGGYLSGSSAAAATVSGVAALLFAADPQASAAEVRRAIIVGARRDVAALRGKVEANGLLSASGALAALARPDETPPGPFSLVRPGATFRIRVGRSTGFSWTPSSDPELERYELTIDGHVTTLPAGATTFRVTLAPGRHRWAVDAFDLSGNRTAATSR